MTRFSADSIDFQLKNVIHNELVRRGHSVEVGTFRAGKVDFVARRADETVYVQVCETMIDPATRERELGPLLDVSHGKVDLKALFCAIEPDTGPPVSQTASSKLQVDGVFKPLPLICRGGWAKGELQSRVNRVEPPLSSGDLSEVRAKTGHEKEQIGIFAVLRQREGIGL